jgi:hypothetical protein
LYGADCWGVITPIFIEAGSWRGLYAPALALFLRLKKIHETARIKARATAAIPRMRYSVLSWNPVVFVGALDAWGSRSF